MQQSRVLFFGIIGLAIVVVAGLVLGRFFLVEQLDIPIGQPEIAIEVVVAPSIKPWADQAARQFNGTHSTRQVTIIAADELIPQTQFQSGQQTLPPAAWLAEASFVVDMAPGSGLQFEDAQSIANTSLAWGAYNDKLAPFNQTYGDLTWQNLHTKAVNGNDILKLVIASPQNSAEGLAALISATAGALNTSTLSGNDISTANTWLTETFGNRNTNMPPRPAEAMASVQGPTLGDAALLAVASWGNVPALNQSNNFTLMPAQPNVNLDYPFAIWAGSQATPEAKQAALEFRQFLLSEDQQNRLAEFSLERAGSTPANSVQVDGQVAINLLRWAERVLQ
jgi:hypothetical protein